MNPELDLYYNETSNWQMEQKMLRRIVLECGLVEELKWKHPCYTFNKKNIVIVHAFKDYFGLSFLKGSLLTDENKILTQPTENMQAGRIIKFNSLAQLEELESVIKSYIFEAVELEKAGAKVIYKKTTEDNFVAELKSKLASDQMFKAAFEKLTPGRQRAYNLYFSAAKQAKTRETRIIQYTPRILKGIGLNDCTCGLSKRMPNCDGSHKILKTQNQ